MTSPRSVLTVLVAFLTAGCVDPEAESTAPLPTRTTTGDSGDDGGGLPTRPTAGDGGTTAPATSSDAEPLTDFEEALVGTWRRYHVSNRGSSNEYEYYEYLSFNEDRTACRWKYGQDSSTSLTDDVFSSSDYAHWRISEQFDWGGAYFRVVIQGGGLDYVFDFGKNRVYPVDFETLIFVPNTDGKSCFVRGGASY